MWIKYETGIVNVSVEWCISQITWTMPGSYSLNYVLSICLFYRCLWLHLICIFRIQIPVAIAVAVWGRFGFTILRIILARKVTRAYFAFLYFPVFSAEEILEWFFVLCNLIRDHLPKNQRQQWKFPHTH